MNEYKQQQVASFGDIVTIDLEMTPENGYVPEPLFDTSGTLTFVLGWGNYLPGLHQLIVGMRKGEQRKDVSIDGGYGKHSLDLVIEIPKSNFKKLKSVHSLTPGMVLNLEGGIQVSVVGVSETTVTVDANHPLAGSGYSCSVTLLDVEKFPFSGLEYKDNTLASETSPYKVATFAMGCFWGGELAFMRTRGVVGTKVGYSQGVKTNPTYEEVCHGETKHREAVLVVYDTRVVSYGDLVSIFMGRLAATVSQYKIELFEAEYSSLQYQHGIYYHDNEQRCIAENAIKSYNNQFKIELKPATKFFDAEDYHQQYLLKGGQSARKDAKETIRCFG